MSKITQYVRHLAVVAIATLLAQCVWAVDGLNYTWRSGWDADPAQTVSYSNYTGENGILFAGQQMGIVAQVKLVSNVSANIINFGGDNRVVLATDADGKYTLSSNIAALNGHTSETAATTGWHRYSMFVRRGVNGSGHAASVIVYEDGNVIFKITDGSFVTGPFRNLTIGGKQGNLAKGGHWSAHLSAGAATADETTAAAIEADCVKMYPPVDETIVAKIGETGYQTLEAAMTYATEHATAEAPIAVKLLAVHTGDVAIPENVTIEMTTDNRIVGAISGAGTVKLSHSSTATQGSLATWIGEGKMTFGEFTGTVHLAAGRFNATSALVPATAKVKVTSGAQLFLDGGTWTNTIEIEGAGYGSETGAIGRAALRFENGNIDGATIVTTGTGDNAPAIGSHNSDRTFACAISGSGDLRLVLGTGAHTYQLTNNTFTGALTIVDANLTVKGTFTNNAIKGAGTYSIALANANSSARINTLFTEGQLADFSGKLLMTLGRFEFASGNETLIPSAVTLATSNQGKIYLGSGTWNNHFVIAGNGWTGDGTYKMGPVALRVDNATFGENASIQAVVESNVVPAIGIYNTNPTLCAITGNGGLRLRSHEAKTITISAANLSGLSGAINLVDANATLEITAAEAATVDNAISGSGKIKKSGEGALTLSGAVSCAVKLAAGTIVSETVTGAVTTDVAGKHVAFDEATNTYSLEIDNVSIAIPTVDHMDVVVTVGGEAVTITGGAITVAPGTAFTVTYTPQWGYCGSAVSTGYTAGAQVTVTAPEAPAAAVAQVAGVNYATVEAALANIGSNQFVMLLADVTTSTITVPENFYGAINLNGHTITRTVMGSYVLKVPASSYLELGGNGGIVNSAAQYPYAIENKGTVVLRGMAVQGMVTTLNGGWTFVEKTFKPTAPVTFYMDWNSIASFPYLAVEESVGSDKVAVSYREFQGTGAEVYHAIPVTVEDQTFQGLQDIYTVHSISQYAKAALVTKSETNATIEILSGTYELNNVTTADQGAMITFTVTPTENYVLSSVTVNGEAVSPDAEGVYSITVGEAVAIAAVAAVPEKPAASVADLADAPEGIEGAHTFTAVAPTATQAAYYGDWNADFIVTFSRDMAAGEVTLTGQSDHHSTEWVDLDVGAVAANTGIPLIAAVLEQTGWTGVQVTYDFVCNTVGTFNCGVKNNLAVGAEDATMTVQLVLSKGTETLPIGEPIEYTLKAPEAPTSWETVTDDDVATIVTDLPTGKTVSATALSAWAEENEVEFAAGITVPVNALIFNVAPSAAPTAETEADAADAILEDLASKVDISKMTAGTLDAATLELLEKEYPMATIKLVESTKIQSTDTAKFFQLSIELK